MKYIITLLPYNYIFEVKIPLSWSFYVMYKIRMNLNYNELEVCSCFDPCLLLSHPGHKCITIAKIVRVSYFEYTYLRKATKVLGG